MYDANDAALVIRPTGIGEILDTGFRLARGHYRWLVMLIARAVIPTFVAGGILVLLLPPTVNLGSFLIGYLFNKSWRVMTCSRTIPG